MRTLFIILITILFSGCTRPQEIMVPKDGSHCLPGSEFEISGITNHSTKSEIVALKGIPESKKWDDDRNVEIYRYRDMTIEISNDHVLYLSTNSKTNGTPSGIHPGMDKSTIFKILGITSLDKGLNEYQFVNCDTEYYLVLKFEKNILRILSMGMDAP